VEKERTLEDDLCEMCPQLTLQQRVGAFCACSGLGYLVAIMGTLMLSKGYEKEAIVQCRHKSNPQDGRRAAVVCRAFFYLALETAQQGSLHV
jgi:hypothetical protein